MTHEQVRELVRQFVADHVNSIAIDDEEDLVASGYVNSLFAVQLVLWLEDTFDIVVQRGDLNSGNFRSVAAIGTFVRSKRDTADAPAGGSRGL